jgi:hypothetical protein
VIGTPFEKVATASVFDKIETESAETPLNLAIGENPVRPWKLLPLKVMVVSDGFETEVTVSMVSEV